jgi:glycosyltransferase involved in cell wall biosynthesis
MSRDRLRVNLMTAGLTPGDAITNYILALARMWRDWGAAVEIYADHIAPQLQTVAQLSRFYEPTGRDLLWYHYSIAADNVDQALASPDYRIMDYHGICPPQLFHGQNAHLEYLCQTGLDRLPSLQSAFDHVIVHSEDARNTLLANGYEPRQLHKFYLAADTRRLLGAADPALEATLSQLEYLLMVGRVVPQKDVLALLSIFAEVHRQRPETALIIAGNRDQADKYQRSLDAAVVDLGLGDRVLFAGQVNNPAVLASLYRHARLLMVTSEWESFCVPIAEALSFGTPAAVHNQPPMTEVAGPAGILFDKRDPQAAAAAIVAVLADGPEYDRLSREAQAWSAHYTDEALRGSVLRFLAEVFAAEASARG